MFVRSYGKPECPKGAFCTNVSIAHWVTMDHPPDHPRICGKSSSAPMKNEREADSNTNVERVKKKARYTAAAEDPQPFEDKLDDDEPLQIGMSTEVDGSKGNTYVIKRHPDKNNLPFYWCTCPSRKFHGTKGDNSCKHIDALRNGSTPVSRTISNHASKVKDKDASSKHLFDVALANKYTPRSNPVGMYVMEKYDGFFGHWDAVRKTLFTRNGNAISLPDWFATQMPHFDVTGELFGGYGKFSSFSGLFNSNDTDNSKWKQVKFIIFDVVDNEKKRETFGSRMSFSFKCRPNVIKVDMFRCTGTNQLDTEFKRVVDKGGEGLILRKDTAYKAGRTDDILKYKKFETLEGKIVGYTKGSGRFAQFTGSVKLVNRQNMEFKCVPPDRYNVPPLGTIVEIECMELTDLGLPRHPRWKGVRTDIKW